jgi:hypothetical protein
MKSAYELALSRLQKTTPTQTLSEEQKKALAEIDSQYNAKIAEQKIFIEGEIIKASGHEPTERELRRQLSSEIMSFQEKRELKKEKIRQGKKE